MKLSKQEARELIVKYHMINTNDHPKGMDGIRHIFDRLQSIQYDPLNVVGTNPELVLQSRILDFNKNLLDRALYEERLLIDAWDKQMCIYQTKDFPLMSRIRKHRGKLEIDTLNYRLQIDALSYIDQILEIIEEKGPIYAKDIKLGESIKHKWGQTKPSSATLDYLFQVGKIGVFNKKNTMKQYDLIERLIHHHDDEDAFESDELFAEYYLLRRIKSMGLVSNKNGVHFSGLFIDKKEDRTEYLNRLLHKELIVEVEIESLKGNYYVFNEALKLHNQIENRVSFLAPLDNMIWDRNLLKDLFDFEYTWEVYTPKVNHKYGYYVLPILYGSTFIGRIEFDQQRNSDTLRVKNIWYENGFKITKNYENEFNRALHKFSAYLGAHGFENLTDNKNSEIA